MTRAQAQRLSDYLAHMVDAISRIQRYVDGMTEQSLMDDEKTQDAVIRNLEVMGEAARNVQTQYEIFAQAHAEVPWALMYAMRNRVAHGYFQVDWALIWKTIHQDLPELRRQIERLPRSLSPD
ncbi:DUF86 domain-containing protein [Hydrogenophaga sp.]|uniref:HepT-like ribonuclease domain-containing protein n=1 Tax=Hydrogenophaga sp. TaxID=1904254 RepID=UPI003AF51E83